MLEGEKIVKVNIESQMKSAYIDYSMSVIVSRALPDVRDGMKPVHRRILYGMHDLGVLSNRQKKKSARIVGDVLGKYHPHGDSAVYEAMVRMAQSWSLRYPLVDGQGNFGSVDGDGAAAMRYTEARMNKISEDMLADIEKDTVDFQNNFDDSLKEPTVLPTRIPALLINGASGIAVGMATNMAPHNLNEVIDGCIAYIENNEITIEELMQYIKAPDFPTGGIIYGYEGVRSAYETGRGRVVIRGEAEIDENENGKARIIVTSIPYQVNKAEMIKKTATLVNEKKIEGISDIRDESDRDGMRIVYELRRDAMPDVVLNKLFQYTALQSSFSINNIALVKGRPMQLNLKDMILHFVEFRHEVVVRRTKFDLAKAEKRAHILEGLLKALDVIDEIITLIRASKTPQEAREGLMETFGFSEEQAKAILAMRLQALVGLEREKLQKEFDELMERIEYYRNVLSDEGLRMEIITQELLEVKEKYGDEKRCKIELSGADFNIEDMFANEDMVITISHMGYIKRTPLREFRRQSRGGRGARGSDVRNDDFVEHLYIGTMHSYVLLFTEKGRCFWKRVFEIPEGTKVSKGRAIQNLIHIEKDDQVLASLMVNNLKDVEYVTNNYIILCTKKGIIKKTSLEAYSRPRQNGINAINIREGDELLAACLTNGENKVLLGLRSGRAVRFDESKVRPMGRTASGVRGITLTKENDEVIGMVCVESDSNILVVSENGYGKRSPLEDYRETNRGGKGVKTINITEKTGSLIALKDVVDKDDLMIINRTGVTIRIPVSDMRVMGRATQGVRLINLKDGDVIAAVAKIGFVEDEDDETQTEEGVAIEEVLIEGVVAEEVVIEEVVAETEAVETDDAKEENEDQAETEDVE